MAVVPAISPVLYRTPLVDPKTGLMTREWIRFFAQLSEGTSSVTNIINGGVPPGVDLFDSVGAGQDIIASALNEILAGGAFDTPVPATQQTADTLATVALFDTPAPPSAVPFDPFAAVALLDTPVPPPVDALAALALLDTPAPTQSDTLFPVTLHDTPQPQQTDTLGVMSLFDTPNANDWQNSLALQSTAPAHQFATGLGQQGLTYAQPAFTDISGAAVAAQLPSDVVYNDKANTFTTPFTQTFSGPVSLGNSLTQSMSSTGTPVASLANTNATAGTSNGLKVQAGTNASDYALQLKTETGAALASFLGNGTFEVGTSNQFTVDNAGDVVVGGTLNVAGVATFTAANNSFAASLSGANNRLTISSLGAATLSGIQLTANASNWFIDNRGSISVPNNRLAFFDPTVTEVVTFASGGNVGIGNTNPGSLFTVGANLFTVAASSGNTAVAGTLAVTGNVTQTALTTTYNNIATVNNGVPSEYASVSLTGKTANLGGTTFYTVPATAPFAYRVCAYAAVTTAGSVSSTLPAIQVSFTDPTTSATVILQVSPSSTGNTVGTGTSGCVIIDAKAGTAINYASSGYASNVAGMTYKVKITLEAL